MAAAGAIEAVVGQFFGPKWLKAQGLPESRLEWLASSNRLVLSAHLKGHTLFSERLKSEIEKPGDLIHELNELAGALIAKALEMPDIPKENRVVEVKPGIFELPQLEHFDSRPD